MKRSRRVEKILNDELTFKAGSELKKDLWTKMQTLQEQTRQSTPASHWSLFRRFIVKTKR